MTMLKTLLTMTVLGSLMGLMVLLLGWITRRWRLHRAVQVWLWALVALRLVCPFGLNASFGLSHAPTRIYDGLLGAQTVTLPENAGAQQVMQQDTLQASLSGGGLQNGVGQPATAPELVHSTPQAVTIRPYVAPEKSNLLLWIWGMVTVAFGLWGIMSYVLFRRRLRRCRWLDVRLEESERVAVPCVVGVFHPRVYLPAGLTPEQQHHTVTHERCHIRRGDHIWKIVAYGILALHWFNPLVWLFYFKFQRDVEMACDELVLRKLGNGARTDYSQTLLDLAKPRPGGLTTPIAFSENSIKSRLLQILKGGTPRSAVTIPAAAVCIALTLLLGVGATEEHRVLTCNADGTVSVTLPGVELFVDGQGVADDDSFMIYTRNALGQIEACFWPAGSKGYVSQSNQYGQEYGYYVGDRVYRYIYDEAGRLVECYKPLGLESYSERYIYEYDALGRLVRVKMTGLSMLNQGVKTVCPGSYIVTGTGNYTEEYAYDQENRLVSYRVLAEGEIFQELVYEYNEEARKMTTYENSDYNTLSPQCLVTTYDENWNVQSITLLPVGADIHDDEEVMLRVTYDYDDAGRLIRECEQEINMFRRDGGDKERHYTYDQEGNLISIMVCDDEDGWSHGIKWHIGPVDVSVETALQLLKDGPFTLPAGSIIGYDATIDPRYRVIPQPGFKP